MNMEGFDNLSNAYAERVKSIRDLQIGDEICDVSNIPFNRKQVERHCFVVALFADKGTLGFEPEDYRGTIYGDFPGNPGDVLEFDLATDKIDKIFRI